MRKEKGFILIIGEYKSESGGLGVEVAIINVYGPCSNTRKNILWDEIENVKLRQNCSVWCVLGDFNSIKSVNERRGIGNRGVNSKE